MIKTPNKMNLFDNKVRATRLLPKQKCVVETKTIGTTLAFNLPLKNFSKTGLLLSGGPYERIPFQLNTIVELKIDPQGAMFDMPFHLLAKIVRVRKEPGQISEYGMQLLSLDHKDAAFWSKTLDDIEAN